MQEKARPRSEASKTGQTAQQATLEQLASKIIEVYQQCGFDRDASLSILQMLTNVEVCIPVRAADGATRLMQRQ